VYRAYHIAPSEPADETPQPAQAQQGPEGTLIRGQVLEVRADGQITFQVDNTDNLAVIEPENNAGKQGSYKDGQRIKAQCLSVETDKAGEKTYFCTLNYPKDLR
jgi:ribosomal protein S1